VVGHFIVCGLGSLGQQCAATLTDFGVAVVGIEEQPPTHWELPGLDARLARLLVGDCRRVDLLEEAGVRACRAVLLVASNEHTNVATALAVRSLNPRARLVLRSAQVNLNRLLASQLGNLAAFEATQLPAPAFAMAALATDTVGWFQLNEQWMRAVAETIAAGDPRVDRALHRLCADGRLVLRHIPASGAPPDYTFHDWDPDARLAPGDILVSLDTKAASPGRGDPPRVSLAARARARWRRLRELRRPRGPRDAWRRLWLGDGADRRRRVGIVYGLVLCVLLLTGTALFSGFDAGSDVPASFFATTTLLLGGYADVFGTLRGSAPFPWWFQLIGLFFALSGIALVGLLYGLVTEALLASKFQFVARRPPIPTQGHVVVIGLGRVGQRVAALLQSLGASVVGVSLDPAVDRGLLPRLPLLVAGLEEALGRVHLEGAKSLVAVTDDELLNLEAGLAVAARYPGCPLVLRTFERQLTDHLAYLLPQAEVLCAYEVAADAFAGAALGEGVLGVFRLNRRNVLIAEYQVQPGDTLDGLLLAEAAYGYAMVPILLQRAGAAPRLLPPDDWRLAAGDRLAVLVTVDGMRRIEQGERAVRPAWWELRLESVLSDDARFEGANALHRNAGLHLADARALLGDLPVALSLPLYRFQAHRLDNALRKVGCRARMTLVDPCAQQAARGE